MLLLETIKITVLNLFLAIATLFPQNSVSIGLVGDPISFLPHEAQITSEQMVSDLVFRKLFKYRDGELVNDLVENWDISDDSKVYNLKLKKDAYWQDGVPVTSNDVIYTLTMNQSLRDEIEIEKISDKEVTITLQNPNAILPSLLTFSIEPSHIPNQQKLLPIGSTSYRISRVMMERNKVSGLIMQSFQKGKQYNKVYFYFYDTDNDLKTAYKLGEITAFFSNSEFSYPHLSSRPVTFIGRYYSLIFNTAANELSTQEVRTVLAKSLNIDELLSRNYYRNSLKAQGPISYSPFTREDFKTPYYDSEVKLTEAQKILFEDELKILLPNSQDGRQLEDFLESSWTDQLEIKLEFQYYDVRELIDKGRAGEFDVVLIGHEVTPDPDRYTFWHSTQTRNLNLANFEDLRADRSLEEGRRVFGSDDRVQHYNIFQDVIFTKAPAVFLYHPGTFLYTSEKTPIPLPKGVYTPSDILENL
jgi:peptide/nickel transport system substrate-binding protein